MSKGTTPRAIRISDELWTEAKAAVAERGDTISEVIRRALEQYIKHPPPPHEN